MKRNLVWIVALILMTWLGYLWVIAPYRQAHRMATEPPLSSESDKILKYIGDRVHGRIRLSSPDRITMDNVLETWEKGEFWNYCLNLFQDTPNYYRDPDVHDRVWNSLPRGLQMVCYLTDIDYNILNGGIRQVFTNMSPYEIEESLKMFKAIGAVESAELLERAIAVHDANGCWKPGWKGNYLDNPDWSIEDWRNDPVLNAIDDARCNDESSHRDYKLLDEYVRKHPEEFLHDPNSLK